MNSPTRHPAGTTAPDAPPSLVFLDGTDDLSKQVLGGKAWGVNRMASMGLPVPPAFCLPTTCCEQVTRAGEIPAELRQGLRDGIAHIEQQTGRSFGGGSGTAPLLVSVRSGAEISMPGMMDTVLNLGVNESTRRALIDHSQDEPLVNDIAERFRDYFLNIVAPHDRLVPEDPWEQLEAAVLAVFASWESPRARAYRAHHGITDLAGTAVTVQAMVFGNLDDHSGTGVVFSRNPITGDRAPYGEWLARAQGEDLVSGSTNPQQLATLADQQPQAYHDLTALISRLENDAGDVQDVEFTIESGRLWVLQTRNAKRSPLAAVRLAVSLAEDGLISRREALDKVDADLVRDSGLAASSSHEQSSELLAQGTPAGPGRRTGIAVDDPDEAADLIDNDVDVVLVRPTTSPDDVHGMFGAVGVVTDFGGSTSHAALVSRELGIACVVGCGAGTAQSLVGKTITVDGSNGDVYVAPESAHPLTSGSTSTGSDADIAGEEPDPALTKLAEWAREELLARGHVFTEPGKANSSTASAKPSAEDLNLTELLALLDTTVLEARR